MPAEPSASGTRKLGRELAVALAVAFARVFGMSHDPESARRSREASLRAATRTDDPDERERIEASDPG